MYQLVLIFYFNRTIVHFENAIYFLITQHYLEFISIMYFTYTKDFHLEKIITLHLFRDQFINTVLSFFFPFKFY